MTLRFSVTALDRGIVSSGTTLTWGTVSTDATLDWGTASSGSALSYLISIPESTPAISELDLT